MTLASRVLQVPALVFLAASVAAAAVCGLSLSRLARARAAADAAERSLVQITGDAQRIVALRSRSETVSLGKRPDRDTIALVNAALAAAGVPTDRLRDLTPEADVALAATQTGQGAGPRSAMRRQSIRLALAPLTLPQLGAFLGEWRRSQSVWTVTRVEIARAGAGVAARGRAASGNEPVDGPTWSIRLIISAVYLDESGSPPATSPSRTQTAR